MSAIEEIRARLFAAKDEKYHAFQCRLMPTVDPAAVIGVRMPALRALAKELRGTPIEAEFVAEMPHTYYEERNLYALLIERSGFADAIAQAERFLPCVDNWATCDLLKPKAFAKHTEELLPHIRTWLKSGETYTVRFGVNMLMGFYLGDAFTEECPALVAESACGDYYIDMAAAWYFAEALVKQREAVLPYFAEKRLPKWTHNKAIQKSIESFRVPAETKEQLKAMRVK